MPGFTWGLQREQHRAQMLRGRGQKDRFGGAHRAGDVERGLDLRRQLRAGKEARVLAVLADALDDVGLARPERDLGAGPRRDGGQRRSPGARADDGHAAIAAWAGTRCG